MKALIVTAPCLSFYFILFFCCCNDLIFGRSRAFHLVPLVLCRCPRREALDTKLQFSRHFSGWTLQRALGNMEKACTVCREISSSAIMPPKKKAANEPTKKTEQKKKEKIIEVFDKLVVFSSCGAFLL